MQDTRGTITQKGGLRSGVVSIFPDSEKQCTGVITDDATGEMHRFHVRHLSNGCEDMLVPQARVAYLLIHNEAHGMQPTGIRLAGVQEQEGVLLKYDENTDAGIIESGDQRFHMDFNTIAGRVPARFEQGLRVVFSVTSCSPHNAAYVRFVDLPSCGGKIVKFNAKKQSGSIKPDGGQGYAKVHFDARAVVNSGEVITESREMAWWIWKGSQVTYHLERVRRADRTKYGTKAVRATEVRIKHAAQEYIQEVQHASPPRARPHIEHVAVKLGEQRVEEPIRSIDEEDRTPEDNSDGETDTIFLYPYNRAPEEFRSVLLEGDKLDRIRKSMKAAGCDFFLQPSGAKVFVWPEQYPAVMRALRQWQWNKPLKASHVIISKSLLPDLEATIEELASRKNVRLKKNDVKEVATVSEGEAYFRTTQGTFLCYARPPRNPGSVSQSTTEAHGGGSNPRRFRGGALDSP